MKSETRGRKPLGYKTGNLRIRIDLYDRVVGLVDKFVSRQINVGNALFDLAMDYIKQIGGPNEFYQNKIYGQNVLPKKKRRGEGTGEKNWANLRIHDRHYDKINELAEQFQCIQKVWADVLLEYSLDAVQQMGDNEFRKEYMLSDNGSYPLEDSEGE